MSHSDEVKAQKARIGQNIRAEIERRGISQTELAKRYGCTRQYIFSLLTEGTVVDRKITDIAKIIGCQPSVLISQNGGKK